MDEFRLRLDGEQTIYQVRELFLTLQRQLNPGSQLLIDLSQVEYCDSAFVQLLLWLRNHAQQNDIVLQLGTPSSTVAQQISLLGLDQLIPFAQQEAHHGA